MIVSKVQKRTKVKSSPASKSAAPEISLSQDGIRERAFQIYENSGDEPGSDIQDWLHAEHQMAEHPIPAR